MQAYQIALRNHQVEKLEVLRNAANREFPEDDSDIHSVPLRVYKKEWNGINDWLGTEISRYTDRKFWPYVKAREYVHKLGLKNIQEWREYCGSGKKPNFIPSGPEKNTKMTGQIMEIGLEQIPLLHK
jgi:hypothetical protein